MANEMDSDDRKSAKRRNAEILTKHIEAVAREEAVKDGYDMTRPHALFVYIAVVLDDCDLRIEAFRRAKEEGFVSRRQKEKSVTCKSR